MPNWMIPNSTIKSTGTRSANSTIDWPRSSRSRMTIRVVDCMSEVPHDALEGGGDRGRKPGERQHDAGGDQAEGEAVLDHRLTLFIRKFVGDSEMCHFSGDFRES